MPRMDEPTCQQMLSHLRMAVGPPRRAACHLNEKTLGEQGGLQSVALRLGSTLVAGNGFMTTSPEALQSRRSALRYARATSLRPA